VSNFSDYIGGGGSASYPTIFLSKSQTWVPPQDGNIMIHVIGAGGSGAARYNNNQATSGAAGGYCRKNSLAVTTSGSFTVVIGAGGNSVSGSTVGIAGGNTTFAGTGLGSTLTANGGGGGNLSYTNASGGTASGGDVNNTGGLGGYQKGGGAVGLTGTGNQGDNPSGVQFRGAECDIVGDFWSSSLGQIAGGKRGNPAYVYTAIGMGVDTLDAGPLSGGGCMYSDSGTTSSTPAGHASIGGGGGYSLNYANAAYTLSGRGGEGIVVIQYIP